MTRKLVAPFGAEIVKTLKAGDRILLSGKKNVRKHGCCSCLSVCTGNCYWNFIVCHQLAEKFRQDFGESL